MEDELYLENIDEFVTDQNRVVTYKWLSYTLGVHVNQAKQMLYDYVERKRKENSGAQLHVTYLVAGNLVQNGSTCHKVAVVKEEKLEAMKSKLSTIACVHVYSIQKATLKDSSPLYNTDYDIIKANLQKCSKFSAIRCAAAVPRTAAEMSQAASPMRTDPQPPQVAMPAVVNGHTPSTSAKPASQQPKGIMGMFASKPAAKSEEGRKEGNLEAKEPQSASTASSKTTVKGNVLSNFFGKAAMSKVSTEPEQQKEDKAIAKSPISSSEAKSPPAVPGPEKPSKKSEPTKAKQKDKKRTKRLEVSDEEEREAESLKKKRRRIKQPQSISSDEEEVPESPVTPEVKDFSPEPVPKPQADPVPAEVLPGEKRRKRRRVLKSKTFVDEEGCIVTEKVYESESCTDSEEDFKSRPPAAAQRVPAGPARKEPREAKKGAAASSRANKQASIMGFFQKK
uniref:DNA polymerase delta subunit 3 n=1 Tax=Salvator merianae TaxID=96440 RepID=A0A8D0BHP5_SALMN